METIATKRDIAATGFAFAENPRWRDNRLWFVDLHSSRVVAMETSGKVETVVETPFAPSGIGFLPDGSLLIVAVHEMKIMRFQNGALSLHADLAHLARCGMNDMLVDPEGRAYVVQYGFDWRAGEKPVAAGLLTVTPDGAAGVAAPDVLTGNGMALSPDGRTFYIAVCGRLSFGKGFLQ